MSSKAIATSPENLPVDPALMSDDEFLNFYKENSGTADGGLGFNLPILRINYQDMDDGNRAIPRGQFTISVDGKQVFAKEVQVRIVRTGLQYSHYDSEENKFVNRSTIENNWNGEFLDERGGTKCGKVPAKVYNDLSEAEKLFQKDLKVSRIVFGFVSINGVDAEGELHEMVDVPFMFYAKGTNFMPISTSLQDNVDRKGLVPAQLRWNWSLSVERQDKVTYWMVVPTVTSTDNSASDKDVRDFFIGVHQAILAENEVIRGKWVKSQKKIGTSEDSDTAKQLTKDAEEVSEGLDDEIPF